MGIIHNLALAGGLSWASGLRLYATVFIVGLLAKFNYVHLPATLNMLSNPIVLSLAGVLCVIEFLADKIPYVDSAWNGIQTFIRIPAGALLAMGAINSRNPANATQMQSKGIALPGAINSRNPANASIAALLGGSLAGATHATKAGSRAMINTSPEPISNIAASLSEESLLVTGGWLAFTHPAVFIGLLCGFIIMMFWLLPKLWRSIKSILGNVGKVNKVQ